MWTHLFHFSLEPTQFTVEAKETEVTVTYGEDGQADDLFYFGKVAPIGGQDVGPQQACTRSPENKATCTFGGLNGCSKYIITIVACPTNNGALLCSEASDPLKTRTAPGGKNR